MAILYLDVDDEITSAAQRLRSAGAGEVALVLQAGSRIATSRINFRLLSREADELRIELSIIAPEASARALAGAAGLPVYATVLEYEDAQRAGEPDGRHGSAGHEPGAGGSGARAAGATGAGATGAAGIGAAATGAIGVVGAVAHAGGIRDRAGSARASDGRGQPDGRPGPGAGSAAGGGADAGRRADAVGRGDGGARGGGSSGRGSPDRFIAARDRGGPGRGEVTRTMSGGRPLDPRTGMADGFISVAPRRERHWRRWVVLAAVVAAVALGGLVGYTILPGASVTLAIRTVPVGPARFEVRADVSVAEPDAVTLAIPATSIDFQLSATGTFKATGKRVDEQTASGTVRWSNCDYLRSYQVPKGSIVKTQSGVQFATADALLLPNASTETTSDGRILINCSSRPGDVVAVKPGKTGNVPARTITIIPPTLDARAISVSNPNPTSGGTHDEFPRIEQKDVDAALVTLGKQIDEQLVAVAAAPDGVPDGAVVYPTTAVRDQQVPTVDPTQLVGLEQDSFDMGVTAAGAVLAVDSSPIDAIGRTRVDGKVPAGHDLVAGSEKVTWDDGAVNGQEVRFQVSATATAVPTVDEARVRQLVRGQTPDAARNALNAMGDATITVWPDWVRTITTLDFRLDVQVQGLPPGRAGSGAGPGPSATPAASASPGP